MPRRSVSWRGRWRKCNWQTEKTLNAWVYRANSEMEVQLGTDRDFIVLRLATSRLSWLWREKMTSSLPQSGTSNVPIQSMETRDILKVWQA
jgi:hypothetical protein